MRGGGDRGGEVEALSLLEAERTARRGAGLGRARCAGEAAAQRRCVSGAGGDAFTGDSLKHKRAAARERGTLASDGRDDGGGGAHARRRRRCRCFAGKRAPTAEEERAAALQRESDEQWARIVELERENSRLSMQLLSKILQGDPLLGRGALPPPLAPRARSRPQRPPTSSGVSTSPSTTAAIAAFVTGCKE